MLVALVGYLTFAYSPITVQSASIGGAGVKQITWTDSTGNARTVSVLDDNHRIIRYTYTIDGQTVTDNALNNWGIGNLVHHGGCGATVSTGGEETEYQTLAALQGPHHLVWRSTFRLQMCSVGARYRVTNEYVFRNGEDSFIQTFAYDASDGGTSLGDDMRGPYNQTDWPKATPVSGFGFGTQYKFVTTGPIVSGDANVKGAVKVPWQWNAPNVIPFVWEWSDTEQGAAVDREYGLVQNQTYVEQDMGGGYYGGGDAFDGPPPRSGTSMPAAWSVPTQLNSYDSNYTSGRITWGSVYGVFQNDRFNDTATVRMGNDLYPINAWSITHVVGKFSDHGVETRVTDTENVYKTTLSAAVGTVKTEGPRGPGSFTANGTMPRVTYANAGYNFVYRTWEAAAVQGQATLALASGGSLVKPSFIISGTSADAEVGLDGVRLTAGTDYTASYDTSAGALWVTLQRTLPAATTTVTIGNDHSVGVGPPATTGVTGSTGTVGASGTAGASGSTEGPSMLQSGQDGTNAPIIARGCQASPSDTPWIVTLILAMALRRRRDARATAPLSNPPTRRVWSMNWLSEASLFSAKSLCPSSTKVSGSIAVTDSISSSSNK
jgi:hypothetical protein